MTDRKNVNDIVWGAISKVLWSELPVFDKIVSDVFTHVEGAAVAGGKQTDKEGAAAAAGGGDAGRSDDKHAHSRKASKLTREQRKGQILECKRLKKLLSSRPGKEHDEKSKEMVSLYRRLKLEVRESCATQIQAVWRGYAARKPISSAFADYATDRISATLDRIKGQRIAAGRPHDIKLMNAKELSDEKQAIKLILVGFDRKFRKKHGRLPSKDEKERFRPIYRLYNDVKKLLVLHDRKKKKMSATDQSLERLRKEKRALQLNLNQYEQTFRRVQGRQIMWESDILPVKTDYERYKVLKAEIQALESLKADQARTQKTERDKEKDSTTSSSSSSGAGKDKAQLRERTSSKKDLAVGSSSSSGSGGHNNQNSNSSNSREKPERDKPDKDKADL